MPSIPPGTLGPRLRKIMDEQPQLLDIMVALCRQKKADGYEQWSVYGLLSALREGVDGPGSAIHLDNNLGPDFALEIMKAAPDLVGFFSLKKRKVQRNPDPEIDGFVRGIEDWPAA